MQSVRAATSKCTSAEAMGGRNNEHGTLAETNECAPYRLIFNSRFSNFLCTECVTRVCVYGGLGMISHTYRAYSSNFIQLHLDGYTLKFI